MKRLPSLPIPSLNPAEMKRFWSKVIIGSESECWLWTAHKHSEDGRGRFWLQGHYYQAPRIAYYLEKGTDPGELLVCHTCDNPACCNPSHLYAGEDIDNAQDRIAVGHQTHPHGTANGRVKLTEKNVVEIRRLYQTGKWSQRGLGRRFGVSKSQISRILHKEHWIHV